MNPDGYAANTRQNAHGVDLNRNWPDNWAHLDPPYYSGTEPLSEPETEAMWRFLWWLKPDYLVVLHQPLYGVDTTDGSYLDPEFRDALARNLGLPKKAFLCGGVCHGSLTGWYTTHKFGVDETIEFGSSPSSDYLTGRARDGIIDAMHGRWGPLSAHDPKRYLNVTPRRGDDRRRRLGVRPRHPRDVHRLRRLPGREEGRAPRHGPRESDRQRALRHYRHAPLRVLAAGGRAAIIRCASCYRNYAAGTGNPKVCKDVSVRA